MKFKSLGLSVCCLLSVNGAKSDFKGNNLATREIKDVEKTKNDGFDFYEIDDSVENKVSAVAIKSFDSSVFENIDEVNITNNKVEVKYEVELDATENIVLLRAYLIKSNESILDTLSGSVIKKDEGEIDVVFNTEEGEIYLSELEKDNSYEECGWFSRLIKTIVRAVVVAVVPPVVRPVVSAAFTSTNIAEVVFSKSNYIHNKKLDNTINDYIYSQNKAEFRNWKVGLSSNIADTGCGYIATYNTLISLGKEKPFSEVIYEFDRNKGKNAYGFLGADPSHIGEYFDKLKIKYQKYKSYESLDNALKKIFSPQMVILCYWNSSSIWDGAHYISFDNVSYDSTKNKYSAYAYNLRNRDYSTKEEFDTTKTIYKSTQGNIIVSYIISMENFRIA